MPATRGKDLVAQIKDAGNPYTLSVDSVTGQIQSTTQPSAAVAEIATANAVAVAPVV